jgi:hypothetical protein
MCRKLQEEYFKWGLNMNITETKYMSLGTGTNHLEMDNGDITGCTEFRYLGTIFTKDGRDTKNIRHRGNTGRENNRCIKWGMVVKEHNKKPERNYV